MVWGLGFFLLTVFGICHQSNTKGVNRAQQFGAPWGWAASQFSFHVTCRQHLRQLISPSSSPSFPSSSFPSTSFPSCTHTRLPAFSFYSCLPVCSFPPPLPVPPLPRTCLSELGVQVSSYLYVHSLSPSTSSSVRISNAFYLHDDASVSSPVSIPLHGSGLRDPTICSASPLECLTGGSDVTRPKQSSRISLPNILSPSLHFKERRFHFPSRSAQLLL